ncbi:ZrgA family zinc uptake protein [Hyphomonas oceanitis]|uniref:Putative lipoprotein n=1 Tax=Hyphomonas oceanitis SCH89 TaxID=1280953 RepID=A0A059G6B3_9PROT|nr:DUF2796 domain-containing protein [Hyphomonas oceanitis]KDA02130.1 putative lipoprotein [Hyphomonas oceanitis SCH89]
MFTSPRVALCLILTVPALALAGCSKKAETPPAAPEVPSVEAPENMEGESAVPETPEVPEAEETASAGGEAHVHGAGEFAVAIDGDLVTVTLDAPLANFGLGEGDTDALEVSTGIGDKLVSFQGGADCTEGNRHIQTRTVGDHSGLTLTLEFTCSNLDKLDGVRLNAFSEFPGFETVDAVFVGPDSQTAAVLTPGNPELATR